MHNILIFLYVCSYVFETHNTNPPLYVHSNIENPNIQNSNRYARRPKFLLNILQCLRHQVHTDVNKMVGNCSSTILCDVDMSPEGDAEDGYNDISLKTAGE